MKITIFAMEIVNNGKTAVQEVNIETTSGKLNELRRKLTEEHKAEIIYFQFKHKASKVEIREAVFEKYDGKCAFTGTPLQNDWQIDHLQPVIRYVDGSARFPNESLENLVPAQKIVNHYKGNWHLQEFRVMMRTLHKRLEKLPKNPKVEKSVKRKKYLLEVASYFGITPQRPFKGKFYFETINK
jgi:5-methylcytosine-specific restriction endonuclease McrA